MKLVKCFMLLLFSLAKPVYYISAILLRFEIFFQFVFRCFIIVGISVSGFVEISRERDALLHITVVHVGV